MARLLPSTILVALLAAIEAGALPVFTMDRDRGSGEPRPPVEDGGGPSFQPLAGPPASPPAPSAKPDPSGTVFRTQRWPSILAGSLWCRRQASDNLTRRADTLIPILKKAFTAEGLPGELVWVAEVESTLKTNAVSATGARGLFQFKPVTARHLGLMPAPDDFRTEPEKSARAAAQYLSYLYRQFGDWRLTVAAYNAGEGCVRRQLVRNKAVLYEEIAAELPPQTQVYVIKVMATVALREKTRLSALPAPKRSSS